MRTPQEDLMEDLKDPEFAKLYREERVKFNIAIMLLKARLNAGLTQGELAAKLGVRQPYIDRLESGEANPTLSAVQKILDALDLRMVIEPIGGKE